MCLCEFIDLMAVKPTIKIDNAIYRQIFKPAAR